MEAEKRRGGGKRGTAKPSTCASEVSMLPLILMAFQRVGVNASEPIGDCTPKGGGLSCGGTYNLDSVSVEMPRPSKEGGEGRGGSLSRQDKSNWGGGGW